MPAAAVIPAPIAYIKVVAVKKLVVGFWDGPADPGRLLCVSGRRAVPGAGDSHLTHLLAAGVGHRPGYCEEIRVFKAGVCLVWISMG